MSKSTGTQTTISGVTGKQAKAMCLDAGVQLSKVMTYISQRLIQGKSVTDFETAIQMYKRDNLKKVKNIQTLNRYATTLRQSGLYHVERIEKEEATLPI